jgi:hypothetical protein
MINYDLEGCRLVMEVAKCHEALKKHQSARIVLGLSVYNGLKGRQTKKSDELDH